MRFLLLTITVVVLAITPTHQATAQSPEFPVPAAVVLDSDGKPMVQILGTIANDQLLVMFNFDGSTAVFEVDLQRGDFNFKNDRKFVWFLTDDCTGSPWVDQRKTIEENYRLLRSFVITEPDEDTGTYRVFGSTSLTAEAVYPESRFNNGSNRCENIIGVNEYDLLPAEEILPNPFEGFHGPTDGYDSDPESMLTISGGTRLP